MNSTQKLLCAMIWLVAIASFGGCGDDEGGGGIYCCSYESRHTGCGGTGWTDWEAKSDEFNIDDYLEGWTPERVCNKYTGSDTECSTTCCINVQHRNNQLASGACG